MPIPKEESLEVEFKSDRKRLPDDEMLQALVCLANAEGGTLYLGVEDDGRATGVHADHRDPSGLAALVPSRTSPPLVVSAELESETGVEVLRIEVPKSIAGLVSTSRGLTVRRQLDAHGLPECVPVPASAYGSRLSDLGLLDASAQPVPQASLAEFDPLERVRLRQLIESPKADPSLRGLGDDDLDAALELVKVVNGVRVPTLLGMLILGREEALRRHVPTHEVAFQVLHGTDVRVNEFMRFPLVRVFQRVEEMFSARVEEQEV